MERQTRPLLIPGQNMFTYREINSPNTLPVGDVARMKQLRTFFEENFNGKVFYALLRSPKAERIFNPDPYGPHSDDYVAANVQPRLLALWRTQHDRFKSSLAR
ncbi:MAG: hypothetical protein Q8O98_01440 [bacterium]|nr:hypothetical protein [bacterium]